MNSLRTGIVDNKYSYNKFTWSIYASFWQIVDIDGQAIYTDTHWLQNINIDN